MPGIEEYIRAAARQRGIDPDIAVRVAKHEGGLVDPVRQSDVMQPYGREESFGPFQLHMRGGLGSAALKAGIDPRDPNQWTRGVDFALDQVKSGGWSPWMGAKAAGVTGMMGVNGGVGGTTLTSVPAQYSPQPLAPGQTAAPPITTATNVGDATVTAVQPTTDMAALKDTGATAWAALKEGKIGDAIAAVQGNKTASAGFDSVFKAMGGGGSSKQAEIDREAANIQPSSIGAQIAASDAARTAGAQQMMATLLAAKRKRPAGLSMIG